MMKFYTDARGMIYFGGEPIVHINNFKDETPKETPVVRAEDAYNYFFEGKTDIVNPDDEQFVKNLNKWMERRLNRIEKENKELQYKFKARETTLIKLYEENHKLQEQVIEMRRTGVFTPKELVTNKGTVRRFSTVDLNK